MLILDFHFPKFPEKSPPKMTDMDFLELDNFEIQTRFPDPVGLIYLKNNQFL